MFLIQFFNSTAALGYPPSCNEAALQFYLLGILENAVQN